MILYFSLIFFIGCLFYFILFIIINILFPQSMYAKLTLNLYCHVYCVQGNDQNLWYGFFWSPLTICVFRRHREFQKLLPPSFILNI